MDLADRAFPLLRSSYYRWGFGRAFPLHGRIARWIARKESARNVGDVPKGREAWEKEWQAGTWDFMRTESTRYAAIAAQIKSGYHVLDVGCGAGTLRGYLPACTEYTGVDVAFHPGTIQADAEEFRPQSHLYDVIVFNESLYYFHDPIVALCRFADYLNRDGRLIISTYVASARARAILRVAKHKFATVYETRARAANGRSWICTVLTLDTVSTARVWLIAGRSIRQTSFVSRRVYEFIVSAVHWPLGKKTKPRRRAASGSLR